MITRAKVGIRKSNSRYANINVLSNILVTPKSAKAARNHPCWFVAMNEEIAASATNYKWTLVPHSPVIDVVGCK